MSTWWRGVRPVVVDVDVGEGAVHAIQWQRGRLTLLDHCDVAGERVLAALGGEHCVCLDVLDAWRDSMGEVSAQLWHGDFQMPDPASFFGPATGFGALREHRRTMDEHRAIFQAQLAHTGRTFSSHDFDRHFRGQWLEAVRRCFPSELLARLHLSCFAHHLRLADRRATPGDRMMFDWSVSGSSAPLRESIESWRHDHRHSRPVYIESWLTPAGVEPTVVGLLDDLGGYAVAVLRKEWKLDVEARDAAVIDGCFVVDLLESPTRADELHVLACRWERTMPHVMTPVLGKALALRNDGRWELHWL